MAKEEVNSEHLFLLECHVSELHFHSPETFDKPNIGARQKVCITISFLHFAELLLCDETSEERMSGKSFLFALPMKILDRFATSGLDPNSFVVSLTFYRPEFNNEGHTHSFLGQTRIPLGEKFAEMSENIVFESMTPPNTFSVDMKSILKNMNGTEIGTFNTSLRMTCFGKMIITHIHMAPSGAERQLPTDLMRKITALTEKHISANPAAAAAKEEIYPKYPEVVASSTPQNASLTSFEEFQKYAKKKGPKSDRKGRDWGDVLGSPLIDNEVTDTKAIRRLSDEEVTAPSYEEITATINGHLLFFQVLKAAKRRKPIGDALQNGTPTETSITAAHQENADQENGNAQFAVTTKKSNKKTGKWEECAVHSTEGNSRGIKTRGKVLIPKDNAKKLIKDEEVAISGTKTPTTQCMLEKMKEAQETCVENEGGQPIAASTQKEVFSLKVGKKIDSSGILRPKVVLKILAPRTKEDVEEENELAELEEKRLERLENRKKLREFMTKETQYSEADIEKQEAPDQANKQAKKKVAGKPKKGKK